MSEEKNELPLFELEEGLRIATERFKIKCANCGNTTFESIAFILNKKTIARIQFECLMCHFKQNIEYPNTMMQKVTRSK